MREDCVTGWPGWTGMGVPIGDSGAWPRKGEGPLGGGACARADALSASPATRVLNENDEFIRVPLARVKAITGPNRQSRFRGSFRVFLAAPRLAIARFAVSRRAESGRKAGSSTSAAPKTRRVQSDDNGIGRAQDSHGGFAEKEHRCSSAGRALSAPLCRAERHTARRSDRRRYRQAPALSVSRQRP